MIEFQPLNQQGGPDQLFVSGRPPQMPHITLVRFPNLHQSQISILAVHCEDLKQAIQQVTSISRCFWIRLQLLKKTSRCALVAFSRYALAATSNVGYLVDFSRPVTSPRLVQAVKTPAMPVKHFFANSTAKRKPCWLFFAEPSFFKNPCSSFPSISSMEENRPDIRRASR